MSSTTLDLYHLPLCAILEKLAELQYRTQLDIENAERYYSYLQKRPNTKPSYLNILGQRLDLRKSLFDCVQSLLNRHEQYDYKFVIAALHEAKAKTQVLGNKDKYGFTIFFNGQSIPINVSHINGKGILLKTWLSSEQNEKE